MSHKTRLTKLETQQHKADRPTWRELMQADGEAWQQIRKDNPDLAAWWDGQNAMEENRAAILATIEATERGETLPTYPMTEARAEILRRLERIAEETCKK